MKHLKTYKQLNESSENLNISDASDSFIDDIRYKMLLIAGRDLTDIKDFLYNTEKQDIINKIDEIKNDLIKAKERYN